MYDDLIKRLRSVKDSWQTEEENSMLQAADAIEKLSGYVRQIAKRAIETQDEFLVEWCKNLSIIVEAEEGE